MKKYIVEFIGTFFLVLTIVMTTNGSMIMMDLAPIAIGTILIALVYAGFYSSGSHYNPAVTLAVWIRGNISTSEVPSYIISQCIGGVLAAFLGVYLVGYSEGASGITMRDQFEFLPGALTEFLGTFALVWVILHTATVKGTSGNSFYGLAIGFTVMGCAYAFGGITEAAFNPAVVLGISVVKITSWSSIGAYLLGQFLAAVIAAYTFKFVNSNG